MYSTKLVIIYWITKQQLLCNRVKQLNGTTMVTDCFAAPKPLPPLKEKNSKTNVTKPDEEAS